ncbi:MAG: helix-turn-helix transcriptional regulator [Dehalococcoidales bacterium]|nr:helix-turn-helix transcriptional regulator [Dehalococcoidales bacterium]
MPRLKVIRERKFLSQRELAVKSGVHYVTIARIETGFVKPRFSTIRKLARALGVRPVDIKL